MSVALDTNVLLYASDTASKFHPQAQLTLHEFATGSEIVYLFWPVVMSYLRIATHPAIFESPLAPDDAFANVEALVNRPHVRTPGEDDGFWQLFRAAGEDVTARGNLVPDAHVATLMHQYGVRTIVSHDRDFRKFEGIRVVDPFR